MATITITSGQTITTNGTTAANGTFTITSNGTFVSSGAVNAATFTINSGGVVTNFYDNGATVTVNSGGTALNVDVHQTTFSVNSGAIVTSLSEDAATSIININSGALVTSVNQTGGAVLNVSSNAQATSVIGNDGFINVGAGGQVTNVSATSGETLTVSSGGTLSTVTVSGGNTVLNANSGAQVTGLTIQNAAAVHLSSGAALLNAVISSGGTLYESGTSPNAVNVHVGSSGIFDLATVNATQVSPISIDSGAIIVANALVAPTAIINSGGKQIVLSEGGFGTATFNFATPVTSTGFSVNGTGAEGVSLACFAGGTRILTADGERPVETIQPSDLVAVRRGNDIRMEPAKWVGYSTINLAHHTRIEMAAPIRVKAGALAPSVPTRDLLLSPEHCMLMDGRFIPVKLLVNGASIAREYPDHPFTYYHIELEQHGILIAEGTESESYLDTGNRSNFDNADLPRQLHPMFDLNPNADRWQTDACAPLAADIETVAPIWQRLAERANELGLSIPTPRMIDDPDLHLLVDGKRINPTTERNQRVTFIVPTGARSVTLGSRFCIPADRHLPGLQDTRRLGVCVRGISIRTSTDETVMPPDHPSLRQGWHTVESGATSVWRWTDGAATIPWHGINDHAVLTIRFNTAEGYPIYDEKLRAAA